jgi:hypothetical protein
MKPSVFHVRWAILALIACAALAANQEQATLAGPGNPDLAIAAVAIAGQNVHVTVVNTGLAPHSATLTVRARLTGGSDARATAVVTVFGGQKAFVHFALPASVLQVQDVVVGSIIDDPAPF